MKKTLSIIIATIILAMSVFSVNVFAAETKTDALLNQLKDSKEVAVSLQAGDIPLFGSNSDASDTFYIKGDKALARQLLLVIDREQLSEPAKPCFDQLKDAVA